MKFPLLLALWLIGFGCSQAQTPTQPTPVGMNLSGVSPYTTEIAFVDVYRNSGPWFAQRPGQPWGQGGQLDLAPEGHVRKLDKGQYAEKIVFPDMGPHFPGGLYTCSHDGQGELAFGGGAELYQRLKGRVVVRVTPAKGAIVIRLNATNPTNPVRNIRLVMEGFDPAKTTFHPDFVKRLEGVGVVRFMDWMRTNGSKVVEWADRPKPDDDNQGTDKGVALEIMAQLCNEAKIDPWVCMPHAASDDYVRQFAKLAKAKLDPARKVYVEYSNEVWNTMFPQSGYCRQKGLDAKLSANDYEATLRYYSQRAATIFRIFEEEFGGKERLVRVLAAQSANPWTGTTIMDHDDAYKIADAIAIAPYFGNALGDPKSLAKTEMMSVAEVLEACRASSVENADLTRKYATEAKKRGLKLFAYEGGQHLVGFGGAENSAKLEKLFHAANRHPRMRGVMLDDLGRWKANGGDLYCIFASMGSYSKWGAWGVLEYHDSDPETAPKFRAVRDFIREQSR